MPRMILVHLNVEVPDTITTPTLADDLADELRGALEVGADEDHAPFLAESKVTVALAEEI